MRVSKGGGGGGGGGRGGGGGGGGGGENLATRLERNRTEHRLDAKPSKRDLEWSDGNVRELEKHVLTSDPARRTPADALLGTLPHLAVDNTDLPPGQVADRVLAWLAAAAPGH